MGLAAQKQIKQRLMQQYKAKFHSVAKRISDAESFYDVLPDLESHMLDLLRGERMTVYKCARNGREIVSLFKTGKGKEIRVTLSSRSIAGYVALSQAPLRIDDVHNAQSLKDIHPKLTYDTRYEKALGYESHGMVVVPISQDNRLLGVLQVINRVDGGTFKVYDLQAAIELASIIAKKFSHELQVTSHPYEWLIIKGIISEKDYEAIKEKAKKSHQSISSILTVEYKISRRTVGESLQQYYQIPYFHFDQSIGAPDELMEGLSHAYLCKQRWVPIAGTKADATILIDDPTDFNRILEIERLLKLNNISLRVGLDEDISQAIDHFFDVSVDSGGLDDLVSALHDDISVVDDDDEPEADEQAINDNTIIKLVNQIIVESHRADASDIHIEPGKEKHPAEVRIRVDGECRLLLTIPANRIHEVLARIKVLSRLDLSERRKPQDGKFKVKFNGKSIELRVATLPTVNGEGAVMRILASGGALPLDKLNLSKNNDKKLRELITHPHGVILVVGPTGSGKTTTLHAVLGEINKPERKIWTAEDPVEITQQGLQQVQVNPKIGFTFAEAMRAFLRADPDVILIGEMRDQETSHIGIEASLTGHLVLSTLHTNSAPETITRLLDLGLDPISFSDALLGVLAQRLMRTLCKDCKEAYKPDKKEISYLVSLYGKEQFSELGINLHELKLYRAKGCEKCNDTGYRGRTGIHELLVNSQDLARLIYTSSAVAKIRAQAIKEGMRTLQQDGILKVFKGQTDVLQLRKVVAE